MKNDYLYLVSMSKSNYEYFIGVKENDIFFIEIRNIPSKQISKSWYRDDFDTSKPLFSHLDGL